MARVAPWQISTHKYQVFLHTSYLIFSDCTVLYHGNMNISNDAIYDMAYYVDHAITWDPLAHFFFKLQNNLQTNSQSHN